MKKKIIIAIDGPAASGKSTTAKRLAEKLKFVYIDTGAMYRACALESIYKNIQLSEIDKLTIMMSRISVDIKYRKDGNIILLNGEDVSARIRESDISKLSSEIATIGIVRQKMTNLQRVIGTKDNIIMDGRDIGTVVFPDADYKFYMEADVNTRAIRRKKEFEEKGKTVNLDKLIEEMKWRDKNDSTRKIAPLKKAKNAIVIDTSNMTIQEQVEMIYEKINKA